MRRFIWFSIGVSTFIALIAGIVYVAFGPVALEPYVIKADKPVVVTSPSAASDVTISDKANGIDGRSVDDVEAKAQSDNATLDDLRKKLGVDDVEPKALERLEQTPPKGSGSSTTALERLRPPPSQSVPSDDTACRDRMKRLGVVSNGPCVDVSDIVANLAAGEYSFNDPKKVYVGEPFTIYLVLKTSDQQNIQDRFAGLPGEVTTKQGKFAQSLEATLHGDDFIVEPSGALARTATLVAPVEWEWRVTAQAGGKKTLTVEVAANIQVGQDKHRVQITTLYEPLIIEVSTFHRIKAYLAEANGFLLAAGATIPALLAIFGLVPKARAGIASAWYWLRRKPKGNRSTRRAADAQKRRTS